jgi:hypothetical protein
VYPSDPVVSVHSRACTLSPTGQPSAKVPTQLDTRARGEAVGHTIVVREERGEEIGPFTVLGREKLVFAGAQTGITGPRW